MTRVIKIQKPTIDIDFVDEAGKVIETFEFDYSDKAAEEFVETYKASAKRIEALTDKERTEKLKQEEVKDFLNLTIDELLGAGTFEKLYRLSPSLSIIINYFTEICLAIFDELKDQRMKQRENVLESYLMGKPEVKTMEFSKNRGD